MRKAIVFSLILLISLLPMLAFAMWSETLRVNSAVSTGEVDWRIVPGSLIYLDACGLQPGYGFFAGNDWNATYLPQPGAIQLDKDVGCTSVVLMDGDGDGDMDTMNVTLHNTYPYYYTHIAFKVHNSGTIPVKIWRVIINGQEFYELNEQVLQQGVELDLTGDDRPDVLIWWGNNFGIQLHPCQSADISFDLTLLQDAPEGATLTFIVRFEAVQWNEYSVPTLRD
ncbi:MAG: hypothetical protein QXH02_04215 [Desulfurococcaceae archaeon]